MNAAIADGRIWFGKDGNGVPRIKTYLHAKERGLTPETWLPAAEVGTNERAKNDLKMLFDGFAVFDTPKPVDLLQRLIQIGTNSDSLVLDFFAGSGTIFEATMTQNQIDGGCRRVIAVQMAEPIVSDSEAGRIGFTDLAGLAMERIRRVSRRLSSQASELDESSDVGFRALRVASTSFYSVLHGPAEAGQDQFELQVESIRSDRSGEDLLFQVLLDWGLELSLPIGVETVGGHDVFIVDDGALIACFDRPVTLEVVREMASREPLRAVFRDSGFATDAARINAEQIFRELSPATDVKVI